MKLEIKAQNAAPAEGSPEEESGETKKFEDHELEHMSNTLMDAHEIKNNPHKMAALKPHLEKKRQAINSVARLREVAKQKGAF